MQKIITTLLIIGIFIITLSGCNTNKISNNLIEKDTEIEGETISTMNIQIKNKNFKIIMYDNPSTNSFLKKLPLTLDMTDLNENEKYYYFLEEFPTFNEKVKTIKAGELMLYGSNCLVLFYESFLTSYSYTKLGYIEDISKLNDVLGSGNVQISFSVFNN